jgi:electron transfer flavoprotein alpha subunit
MKILVFAERYNALTELCSGARKLGERVEAIVIGSPEQQGVNADKVWSIPAQEAAMLEDYTETLAALLQKEKPDLLLVEPTKRGKLIAGRLAAVLETSVITDVLELAPEGEAKRMVYGGAAVRREKAVTGTAIVMAGPGVLTGEPEAAAFQGEVETLAFIKSATTIKVISKEQKPKVFVNLPSAKRLVGVGRGIAKEEDLALVRQLAEVIGAEVGCTRPIAEGEKWMPKETYIGVSGLMLAPEVYLALGISGQVQHTVGINRAKVVIAINKDKNAPIFKQADYGIVGDLYKVVPAMINQLK